MENLKIFKNSRVVVTGHTGFKGSWLSLILKNFGAEVYGISLKPETNPNLFQSIKYKTFKKSYLFDLRNYKKTKKILNIIKPEVVFHLAAQPIVSIGYEKPYKTYTTNILSTINVFESLRNIKNCKIILTSTTDKVYKIFNKKNIKFKEKDFLGGHDPYSVSKVCVEQIIENYKKVYFNYKNTKIITVRGGNIIGGGDWSKNRIIPDIIRSWKKKKNLHLRFPNSSRPWQHVLDALSSYIFLCETKLSIKSNNIYNVGPFNQKMIKTEKLVKLMGNYFSFNKYKKEKKNFIKETQYLSLDTTKIYKTIKFKPKLNIEESIKMTAEWYLKYFNKEDVNTICKNQIKFYYDKI